MHAHHWIIAEPAGPKSLGRCECGVEKLFNNLYEFDKEPADRSLPFPVPITLKGSRKVRSSWGHPDAG